MISARTMVISISMTLLSASLMSAQEGKILDVKGIDPRLAAIQELPWQSRSLVGASLSWVAPSPPSMGAPDLSRYRNFQFGMTVPEIAKLAGVEASTVRVIHSRPAMIQELEWQPRDFARSSPQADSVNGVLFSFYNGELFRMVIDYDSYKTEGMTVDDMVDVISSAYGTATRPAAGITVSTSEVYNDSEIVIARWEDLQYSFNLFHSSYKPTFGVIAFSKKLDALARTAVAEAIRLDEREAPRREIDRQKKQAADDRAAQEKARELNKAKFRF
ncbi:MAG: hypothetical protein LAO31_16175 [Acidobacteriia bacterium]|nr:hypothetical protein [Terriglobia bacterium]